MLGNEIYLTLYKGHLKEKGFALLLFYFCPSHFSSYWLRVSAAQSNVIAGRLLLARWSFWERTQYFSSLLFLLKTFTLQYFFLSLLEAERTVPQVFLHFNNTKAFTTPVANKYHQHRFLIQRSPLEQHTGSRKDLLPHWRSHQSFQVPRPLTYTCPALPVTKTMCHCIVTICSNRLSQPSVSQYLASWEDRVFPPCFPSTLWAKELDV